MAEVTPFVAHIMDVCLAWVAYDPDYDYDAVDVDMGGSGGSGSDDDDESDDGYGDYDSESDVDDDDSSWKVHSHPWVVGDCAAAAHTAFLPRNTDPARCRRDVGRLDPYTR